MTTAKSYPCGCVHDERGVLIRACRRTLPATCAECLAEILVEHGGPSRHLCAAIIGQGRFVSLAERGVI